MHLYVHDQVKTTGIITLLFETKSLTELGVHLLIWASWTVSSQDPPVFHLKGWSYRHTLLCLALYVGDGDLSFHPYNCDTFY